MYCLTEFATTELHGELYITWNHFILRSSYADGRWYRVLVVHTSVNATLTVNPVGSLETPDGRYVDTGETVMDSGHVITFGALNPNRLVPRLKQNSL